MSENIIKESTEKIFKLADDAIEPIKSRLVHPFFSSFIIAWITWNWKPIAYFLFSKSKVEEKFIYINSNLYGHWFINLSYYFLIPGIIAIIYTFFLRKFDRLIDNYNKKAIDEKETFDHNMIMEKYDKKIQYAEKQSVIVEKRAFSKKMEEQTAEIVNLKDIISLRDESILAESKRANEYMSLLTAEREKSAKESEERENKYQEQKIGLVQVMNKKDIQIEEWKTLAEKYQSDLNKLNLIHTKQIEELNETQVNLIQEHIKEISRHQQENLKLSSLEDELSMRAHELESEKDSLNANISDIKEQMESQNYQYFSLLRNYAERVNLYSPIDGEIFINEIRTLPISDEQQNEIIGIITKKMTNMG